MNKLFNNAKFGDKFLTRNGDIAIYQRWFVKEVYDYCKDEPEYITLHSLFSANSAWCVDDEGIREDLRYMSKKFDIVSPLNNAPNTENINNDALANLCKFSMDFNPYLFDEHNMKCETWNEGFNEGVRVALSKYNTVKDER